MATYFNQSIGSHDVAAPDYRAHQYVTVWYDDALTAVHFHSVGAKDENNCYYGLHGVSVEPRYIWAAIMAFSCCTNLTATFEGHKGALLTWVTLNDGKGTEELRLGGKFGRPVARVQRTGYVQGLRSTYKADEESVS